MSQNINAERSKINLARIKKFGQTFEINIDPDAALKYKRGETTDLREVLLADKIFSDVKKGLLAGQDQLQKVFRTAEIDQIAAIILKEGEIQATSEQRSLEREQKKKKLIYLLSRQSVDAKTGLPIPPARIESAWEEAKIHLTEHQTAEEQFNEIISKLRPILPLKIEQKKVTLTIPAQYAGKMYGIVSGSATIIREEWQNDGSWKAVVELPAGLYPEFLDKLNSLTHGEVMVEG